MSGISLRRAEPRDAVALSTFAARLFRETYASDTAASDLTDYLGKNFHLEQQHAEIVDPHGVVFLAVKERDDEAILGYAHLVARPAGQDMPLLNRLYVDREYRGTGLAGRLLEAVRDECRRSGAARLRLGVFEKNARAFAFYRRWGFVVTGATTFTIGDDVQRDFEMQMPIDADGAAAVIPDAAADTTRQEERPQIPPRQCQ